jgi:basic membrane protein A and related proteins
MRTAGHRLVLGLAAVALATGVGACGKSADDTASSGGGGSADKASDKKVALVIAQGGLGDGSYNDLANKGFKAAIARDGISGRPVQSKDIVAQAKPILQQATQSGFGLIIDLEFSHAEALPQVAKANPKTTYALLNVPAKGANVVSVLFQEQQSSYLAGYLAAKVTTLKGNPKVNPQPIIGVVGGTKSTGIDKFIVGYIQGAKAANPKVKVLTAYANSFGDPTKGRQIADSMFKRGADVVYAVAGGTGTGVIRSAKSNKHYAIGVDDDQDGQAPGYVLTSALKRTDLAVEQLVDDFSKDSLKGGSTITLGLKEDGVGLSAMKYTKKDVPQDVLDDVAKQKQGIEDGSVKVWNVIEQGYPSYYKG